MCDWFFSTTVKPMVISSEIVVRHIDSIVICQLCDTDIKHNVATCSSCEYHLGHPICVEKKAFQNCPLCFTYFSQKA